MIESRSVAHRNGRPGLLGLWLILAALVFVPSFGALYFFSISALAVAVALVVLRAPRPILILASGLATVFGVYLVTLIPHPTGFGLLAALLAAISFATALYTWPRRSTSPGS